MAGAPSKPTGDRGLSGEDAWIADLVKTHALSSAGWMGIGDDAAILTHDGPLLFANDTLVDGVHFLLTECAPMEAAFKAVAANVSDIAACGGTPMGMVVGLVAPAEADRALLRELNLGLHEAATHFACPLLGGDTNVADGPLVLSVSMLGGLTGSRPLLRSGAKVGDTLSVTGALGGSMFGRHLRPRPRLDVARILVTDDAVHAVMDISDGLRRDLPRMCAASSVGAQLIAPKIPVHEDVAMYAPGDMTPLDHALDDGEDFELLVAHSAMNSAARQAMEEIGTPLIEIGRITAAKDGIRIETAEGEIAPLGDGGWDHLRSSRSG